MQVGSLFSDGGGPVIVVDSDPTAAANPPAQASGVTGPGDTTTGDVAAVADVTVFDESGDSDNADRAARVIDGDPTSEWRTFQYKQQFPALKPGVGLMLSFPSAVQLSSLTITSPSRGTVVEVRSAPTATSDLADTTRITEATLQDRTTQVSLSGSQAVTHVLLWITDLGGGDGTYVSQIDEVQFRRAAG